MARNAKKVSFLLLIFIKLLPKSPKRRSNGFQTMPQVNGYQKINIGTRKIQKSESTTSKQFGKISSAKWKT